MSYRYYACDVFTERLFGGNPLAVLNPFASADTNFGRSATTDSSHSQKAILTGPSTNFSSSLEWTNIATPLATGVGRSAARSDQRYPGAMARRTVDLQCTSETGHAFANAEETKPAELDFLSI
jgi:hypothetical protein